MEATAEASPTPANATGTTRDRMLAILGALAGALAVSGSLLTWLTVQKHHRSVTVRGTSFGAGKLALIAGIVVVVAAVVWIVATAPRLRAASAVIALAAGAAITISIGAGLASRAFFDAPATSAKHTHQHQKKSASPSPSGTAVGAAFVPGSSGHLASTGAPSTDVTFRAMAGGGAKKAKGSKGTTSTLGAGVFIALAGGILAMIAGIWSLLTGRSSGTGAGRDNGSDASSGASPGAAPADPEPEPEHQPTTPIPSDPGGA